MKADCVCVVVVLYHDGLDVRDHESSLNCVLPLYAICFTHNVPFMDELKREGSNL